MRIAIVDYGMGNISSIVSALRYIGVDDIIISNNPEELAGADKLILPGVGNYANAAKKVVNLNLKEILYKLVVVEKKPILGICLGMQILGLSSTESGFNQGLGFVDGCVDKFEGRNLKIPHVGYNQVSPNQSSRLYDGLSNSPDFYFTHSFKMMSESDIGESMTCYGNSFIASFEVGNIAGVQFHPELSQTNGLKLLQNFVERF
uniref:Imidazole glycerol phosphate synthase subunit HisH n=1 Tax=Aliivibrio wodanis TaxID=80852 RepID=A0A5Q4ZQM6_9GAMM|nr:Imidazole glycerol phosphate synthase subunit HisH [Aliivibrio wodanis]